MRLLYIHQYFAFPEESKGTRSYDLATAFVRKGIQVVVISSNHNEKSQKRWEVYEREGIQFYMLNCPYDNSMSFGKRIGAFLKFMWFASWKALMVKCDCVLATSTPLTIAIPALVRKWVKGTPFVFEVRDVWPEVPVKMGIIKNSMMIKFLYWFEKLVYKNAAFIVPLSSGMDENIKSRCPNEKSVVIPNISEINRFANLENKIAIDVPIEGKRILLYAGTFGTVNGLKYVVDLACETESLDSDLCYFLFGAGKEKEEVAEYAGKKGVLDKNVYIFPPTAKKVLPYLYSLCTVGSSFVIDNPVLWDNSANKFFDTLAAGRPIVINHQGWQAETIKRYDVGYVLSPKVTRQEALSFVNYMNDEERITRQGRNALELAKKEFSLEVAVGQYMEVLGRVSDDKK